MNMRTILIAIAIAIAIIITAALVLTTGAKAYDEDWVWKESRATNRSHCANYGVDAACAHKTPWHVRQAKRRAWLKRQEDFHAYRRYQAEQHHGYRRHYDHEPHYAEHRHTRKIWRDDRAYVIERDDRHDDRDDRYGRGSCKHEIAVVGDQYVSEEGAKAEADKQLAQTARYMFGERFMAKDHAKHVRYECGRSSVGSVVGQVFYRCRVFATPCSPTIQRGN